jgi:hypothetical protein
MKVKIDLITKRQSPRAFSLFYFSFKMFIFFYIFFLNICLIVFSIKTDIKFSFNVPSLFRCKRNGRLFYFDKFPSDENFHHTIINQTNDCDLSLISSNKRVILDIDKLELHCNFKFLKFEDRVDEILFFKSNCSANDRCIRITPPAVTIITNDITKSNNPILFDLDTNGIGTEHIHIGSADQNSYSVRIKRNR